MPGIPTSARIPRELITNATALARDQPTATPSIYVDALNQMIDVHGKALLRRGEPTLELREQIQESFRRCTVAAELPQGANGLRSFRVLDGQDRPHRLGGSDHVRDHGLG